MTAPRYCQEAADVNGDGAGELRLRRDLLRQGELCRPPLFGKDGDFDIERQQRHCR